MPNQKLDPKVTKFVTTAFLVFTILWVTVHFIVRENEEKLLAKDGIEVSAKIVRLYTTKGQTSLVYSYRYSGKDYESADASPGHLKICKKTKACYGEEIQIIVSKSKPNISRIISE